MPGWGVGGVDATVCLRLNDASTNRCRVTMGNYKVHTLKTDSGLVECERAMQKSGTSFGRVGDFQLSA